MLLTNDENLVHLWEVSTGREIHQLHRGIDQFAFSPDQQMLATVWSHTIQRWDLKTGREIQPLEAPRARLVEMHLSADGRTGTFLEWGAEAVVRQYDLTSGKELRQLFKLPNPNIFVTQLSPDCRLLADVSYRPGVKNGPLLPTVSFWEFASGKEAQRIELPGARTSMYQTAFTPDGKFYALGKGKNILGSLGRGRRSATLGDHGAAARTARPRLFTRRRHAGRPGVGRDESEKAALRRAVVGDGHRENRSSSFRCRDLNPHLRFAPDGLRLAVALEGDGVGVWNATTGKEWRRFPASGPGRWPSRRTAAVWRSASPIGTCNSGNWPRASSAVGFRATRLASAAAAFTADGRQLVRRVTTPRAWFGI